MKEKAIVLLSGGLDSTTCLAVAVAQGYETYSISFDYGQRLKTELELAAENAVRFGAAAHHVVKIDNAFFQSSALANPDLAVPKNSVPNEEIPVTYVPARNTIFLSYALAYAESVGAGHIYIGVNSVDYSGYPDCRPEFIAAFETMANLATKQSAEGLIRIKIETPLLTLPKSEIIKLGKSLGVDYAQTLTCYDPIGRKACGECDSCLLRKKGFEEAGLNDETVYA